MTARTLREPFQDDTWIMNQPSHPFQKRKSLTLESRYLAFWVFYAVLALCSALAAR